MILCAAITLFVWRQAETPSQQHRPCLRSALRLAGRAYQLLSALTAQVLMLAPVFPAKRLDGIFGRAHYIGKFALPGKLVRILVAQGF